MSELSFNEPSFNKQRTPYKDQGRKPSVLEDLLIGSGIVSTKRGASFVLIGVLIFCLTVSGLIYFSSKKSTVSKVTTPENLESAGSPQDFLEY